MSNIGEFLSFDQSLCSVPPLSGSDILAHPLVSDSTGAVTSKAQAEVLEHVKEEFLPELLNQLDSMLIFNWLTHDSILCIVNLWHADVAACLVQWHIKFNVDDAAHKWVAQKLLISTIW